MGSQHRAFKALDLALRQERAQRKDRMRAWSEGATAAAVAEEDVTPSLLDVMQRMPPAYGLIDLLPLASLLPLARASKAWYAYVAGDQLPRLLRRTFDSPALAPWAWDYSGSVSGPSEDVWESFAFRFSSTRSSTSTSSAPPLLTWCLGPRSGAAVIDSARSAVGLLLHSWFPEGPSFPRDDVAKCLRLMVIVAGSVAMHHKKKQGWPTRYESFMVCFYLPPGAGGDGSDNCEGLEVVCDFEWGGESTDYGW